MLSNDILSQKTSFVVKSLWEICVNELGYSFIIRDSRPFIINNPGLFAEFCRLLYRSLQNTSISEIHKAVAEEFGTSSVPNNYNIYFNYIRTQYLQEKLEILLKEDSKVNKSVLSFLGDIEYLDKLQNSVIDKSKELCGDVNIYMLYSRVAQIRNGICVRARALRRSNRDIFEKQPHLYEALQYEFEEWLKTNMNLYEDENLHMESILGTYMGRGFLSMWFATKYPKYHSGQLTASTADGDLAIVDLLTVNTDKHIDLDLYTVMNRIIDINRIMFRHSNAMQSASSNVDYQYSILEYYIEKKLSKRIKLINTMVADVIATNKHQVKVPYRIRLNCNPTYRLNMELGTKRIYSSIPGGTNIVDSSFIARVKNNKRLLKIIDNVRSILTLDNVRDEFKRIALIAYSNSSMGKDSNKSYIPQLTNINVSINNGTTEQMVVPVTDEVYSLIANVIQSLCDLELLDHALESYGLSIVDLPRLYQINDRYFDNVRTIDGLVNDMLNQTYQPSFDVSDGYQCSELIGLSNNEVLTHIQEFISTQNLNIETTLSDIAGTLALKAPPSPKSLEDNIFHIFDLIKNLDKINSDLFAKDSEQDINNPRNYANLEAVSLLGLMLVGKSKINQAPSGYNQIVSKLKYNFNEATQLGNIYDTMIDRLCEDPSGFIARILALVYYIRSNTGDISDSITIQPTKYLQTKCKMLYTDITKAFSGNREQFTNFSNILKIPYKHNSQLNISQKTAVLTYLGYMASKTVFPTKQYTMYLPNDEFIVFNLADNTITFKDDLITGDNLRNILSKFSLEQLIAKEEHSNPDTNILYASFMCYIALSLAARWSVSLLPRATEQTQLASVMFNPYACAETVTTIYTTLLNVTEIVNAKVLPILKQVQVSQAVRALSYKEKSSKRNGVVEVYNTDAVLYLYQVRNDIRSLHSLISSIRDCLAYPTDPANLKQIRGDLNALNIKTFVNFTKLDLPRDDNYCTWQTALILSTIDRFLNTNFRMWDLFLNEYNKLLRDFAFYCETKTSLQAINAAIDIKSDSIFKMNRSLIQYAMDSQDFVICKWDSKLNMDNNIMFQNYLRNKRIDSETGFVTHLNGVYCCLACDEGVGFIHESGLVIVTNIEKDSFAVMSFKEAMNRSKYEDKY